jgi:hypothetical protein
MQDVAREPGLYLGSYDSLVAAEGSCWQQSRSSMALDAQSEEMYCVTGLIDQSWYPDRYRCLS